MPWLEIGIPVGVLALVTGLVWAFGRSKAAEARAEERQEQATLDAALQREVNRALESERDGRASDDLRRLRDG